MLNIKKLLNNKRMSQKEKQNVTLLGLVDLFIKTKKPIGSNTLKDSGFDFLSSATIRNYFSKLEKEGFLHKQHSSGGRTPTDKAYRLYANYVLEYIKISSSDEKKLSKNLKCNYKKVTHFLESSANLLSEICSSPAFLLKPKFNQDYIQDIKIVKLFEDQLLCIIITNFGQINTISIPTSFDIEDNDVSSVEKFLLWRLNKSSMPEVCEKISKVGQKIYSEIMLRHVSNISRVNNFDNFYKTGISKILNYKEFQDPTNLANALSLFEKNEDITTFLHHSMKMNSLSSWIGEELLGFDITAKDYSIITIPYKINELPVGAIGLLLPKASDYGKIFSILKAFSEHLSATLTKTIYKFKIDYQPSSMHPDDYSKKVAAILLEDKSKL